MSTALPVDALRCAVRQLVETRFRHLLPGTVTKNIVETVPALLVVSTSSRGWYGRLSMWGIARAMGAKGTVKSRRKRLDRFLSNPRFDVMRAWNGLMTLGGIEHWGSLVPVLIDQTTLCKDAVQAIVCSSVHGCRSIPFDMTTFVYEEMDKGQNSVEEEFFSRVLHTLAGLVTPVLVMDRGYAKLCHLRFLLKAQALFVIRGCRNVIIEYGDAHGKHRMSLGRLPHRQGTPIRYRNVRYKDGGVHIVDIIVYRGRGFKEPWYLIVPSDREGQLGTEDVVRWYRWRMRIETTFRDFKSCPGVRKGLHLLVDPAVRMSRIMLCLCIAYVVLLVVGDTGEGRRVRSAMEVRRRRRRHGARRTLSLLSVALFTLEKLLHSDHDTLRSLLTKLTAIWTHGPFSPGLEALHC